MFLETAEVPGAADTVYTLNDRISMKKQTVVVKVNFRADTLHFVSGWKKKSKMETIKSNSTSIGPKKSDLSRRSSKSDATKSNEVEVYFPAKETRVSADIRSIHKLHSDHPTEAHTSVGMKESGK